MGEQPQSPELAELERVLASPEFHSSRRSQRVLRYLVEHALSGDSDGLKERSVGFELFDRDPDYDTARDSIVRVAANDVRKRLAEYYTREYRNGAVPALRIVVPAGSYVPVFQRAERALEPVIPAPAPASPPVQPVAELIPTGRRRFDWRLALVIAAVAIGSAGVTLWVRPAPLAIVAGDRRPTVDLLWDQVFRNGRPTCMVLSDANLTMFEEMLGRQLAAQEYAQDRFTAIAESELKTPEKRAFAELLMRPPSTSMADASAARAFGVMNSNHRIQTDMVFARDFGTQYFDSHNVVLLGSLRSNPWVSLFEDRLNFRSGASEAPVRIYFENQSPKPGESQRYWGVWNKQGYCRVAFLPSVKKNGNVLILSGTNLSTTAAGSEFVTNEEWLRKFRKMLGPAARKQFPHFEVLLRVDLVAAVALNFEIAAWRTY